MGRDPATESGRPNQHAAEPKPKSGLVISLTYEDWKYGYHIYAAEVYNSGDKTESISPNNFVLVTDRNESIEAQIPFERAPRRLQKSSQSPYPSKDPYVGLPFLQNGQFGPIHRLHTYRRKNHYLNVEIVMAVFDHSLAMRGGLFDFYRRFFSYDLWGLEIPIHI